LRFVERLLPRELIRYAGGSTLTPALSLAGRGGFAVWGAGFAAVLFFSLAAWAEGEEPLSRMTKF
jgi:hypothetical protein